MSSDEECLVLRINVTLKYIGDRAMVMKRKHHWD